MFGSPHDTLIRPEGGRRPVFRPLAATVNGLKTVAVLAGLGGLLVAVGSLFGQGGAFVGLVLGVALAAGSWWFSDRLALAAAGAVPANPRVYPEYHRIVAELCSEAGLPLPRLYVTPDRQPNAFATGRDPDHAAVAVTAGIMELLSWEELKGVLAHELAHVGNRDILITSIAAAVATGISYLANMVMWLPFFGAASDDDDGPGPLGLLVTALLAPLAATILQLALSRSREYDADAAGARLLGDGRPLASALAKLDRAARAVPMHVEPAQAAKYIVNPLTGRHVSFAGLFSTHPPISDRIARLTAGGWRRGRGPMASALVGTHGQSAECGFDPDQLAPTDAAVAVRSLARRWRELVEGSPSARTTGRLLRHRFAGGWSPMERVSHVDRPWGTGAGGRIDFNVRKPRSIPLPFGVEEARAYGRVFAAVTARGRKARGARAMDPLIAATAVAAGLLLYTRNGRDFDALGDLVTVVVG